MNRTVRIVIIAVVGVLILWLLFTVVFPWVEQRMEDPTLGTGQAVARTA